MNLYGLIGKTLKHSFSQKYFREKFLREGLKDNDYLLFELSDLQDFPALIKKHPQLRGLNVTIPYKQEIIPFLNELHPKAKAIGAVNTIKIKADGALIGYNTDFFGFKKSLEEWLVPPLNTYKALVLGTGGASKAVVTALKTLEIAYQQVSRKRGDNSIDYNLLREDPEIFASHKLIINTTPLGMSPNINDAPEIPYDRMGQEYYLYDLVYNPSETLFLKKGKEKGAKIMNGMDMLELQAAKAWEIWNQEKSGKEVTF